jgi:hypothetical protein
MGILSDFLVSPVGETVYGAMAETLERANKKADDQVALFRGLGTDLRAERIANEKKLNQKLSNFRSAEIDFMSNAGNYNTDWEKLPDNELKSIWAPMAKYLKADTFLGTRDEVQQKVTQALIQSGGLKIGDPYTSVEEFTNKTKASISGPLKRYSDMGYNTFQNQIGDLSYKTPEYNLDAVTTTGLRITAMNFKQFYPQIAGLDNPAVTAARLSILSENARNDSMITNADGKKVLDSWKFAELKQERFNAIKDELDMMGAANLFGLDQNQFLKLVESGSPSLAILTSTATKLATMDQSSPEYQETLMSNKNALSSHIQFLSDMSEGLVKKYLDKDSALTTVPTKISMTVIQGNFRKDAFKINKAHRNVLNNPNSVIGISLKENAAAMKIPGNEGRNAEQFTFVSVPQGLDAKGNALPMKWVIVSSTGVTFEMPNIGSIARATKSKHMAVEGKIPSNGKVYQGIQLFPKPVSSKARFHRNLLTSKYGHEGTSTVDDFNAPSAELKAQAIAAIKLSMEGYLKLNFVRNDGSGNFIQDSGYVKQLEDAGLFGKNSRTGENIKYFGH